MSNSASPEQIDEIRDFVATRVAEGFDSEEDIVENASEYFSEEFGDSPELKLLVTRLTSEVMAEHMLEERSWTGETDCDRLDKAFDELERNGIVARQNFTCCQTCGHAEIWEEVEQAKQETEVKGYVFYHMQDTERVLEEGRLYLAYGASENADDETALRVAGQISEILQNNGFQVDWNGSLDKRICLENLSWRRRRAVLV
ncbi:MAG: hypothetical protein K2X27_02355 [Candidatus Obscuribacterales bacterium]|nr:hypothetical protein [Candidatus Obscuribacterales bacterium]